MILARKSQLHYYVDVPLYVKSDDGRYVMYKPGGKTLSDMRISEERLPVELYMKHEDKLKGLQEAQRGFNRQLQNNVKSGDPAQVKSTLISIVEETLMEPRSGSLEGVSETMDILISDYAGESDVIKQLLFVSSTDYSTVIHSINVMAFALAFASHAHLSTAQTKVLGISALLHDVGKVKITPEILTAPRILNNEEFEEMKSHTLIGYQILRECGFSDKGICLAALEHHEKLDGTGYPNNKKNVSEIAKIIAVIDCYEALTNNDRPYRCAMIPIDTLNLLKDDVNKGKFDKDIFKKFAYSLVK